MNIVLSAILAFGVVLGLAIFWMTYLIKIVLNDEEVQERIRRIQRQREEKRRQVEDRLHKEHQNRVGGSEAAPAAAAGPGTPQAASGGLKGAADKTEKAPEKKA